jgi:hypothetical protein
LANLLILLSSFFLPYLANHGIYSSREKENNMYKVAFTYKIDADTFISGECECEDEATMILAAAEVMAEFVAYGIPGSLSFAISSKVS